MTSRKTPAANSNKGTSATPSQDGPKGAVPKGAGKLPQFSPAELAQREKIEVVFKEVEAVRTKITEYRGQISKLEETRRQLIKAKQDVQKKLRDLGDQRRGIFAERGVVAAKYKELRDSLDRKKSDVEKYKDRLPFKNERSDEFVSRNTDALNKEIAKMEDQLSTRLSLSEEKKIITELSILKSLKNVIKDFDIKADIQKMSEAREELDTFSERLDVFRPSEDSLLIELQAANNKVVENTKRVQAVFVHIKAEDAKIDALITKRKQLEAELGTLRQKRIDDNRANREKQQAEREAKRAAFQEEKRRRHEDFLDRERRRQEDRAAQEMLIVPFEEELSLCDNLLAYLESIAAQKKAKGELKLKWEVYLSFEHISTVPPKTYAEVDQTIATIKAKKEYFQQLSKQKQEQRKAALALENSEVEVESTEAETASEPAASEPAEVSVPVEEAKTATETANPVTEGENKVEVPADQ